MAPARATIETPSLKRRVPGGAMLTLVLARSGG